MTTMNKSMLSRPQKLTFPYGWCGHIPFVSWLVEEMKPGTIVELGTHSGNSYFSICQAVLQNNTGSKCYAVDTWQGDEHAGLYSESVYTDVRHWNQQFYSSFSNLLRMTFDQASEYFAEKTINLLHIDGLHTYEAVKNDFETWLPKLADDAIVLFHDTNVREREFGVWKLWEELQVQYPNFEFHHSHGLGVLFVGNNSHKIYERLISMGDASLIREAFSRLGELVTLREEAHNHIQGLESAKNLIENHNTQIQSELDNTNKKLEKTHRELEKAKSDAEFYIKKIQHNKNTNDELERRLYELENAEHHKNLKVMELEAEIKRLLNTNSWKITKPLRFMFRVLRGQQKDTVYHLKREARSIARSLYYRAPYKYREQLLSLAFKTRPSWFSSHPRFGHNDVVLSAGLEKNEQIVDVTTLSAEQHEQPGRIAVHCHIFYNNLVDEFVTQLAAMPFKFDAFISVADDAARKKCESVFRKIPTLENIDVKVVINRGRDIAPMLAEFGSKLKQYDYICHVQSKKSLYNGGKTTGWREYLLDSLFGSELNIRRIFKAFKDQSQLGIIYPQVYGLIPYQAFTWLANRQQGTELCARIGIACPDGYFNFPAGSMFWAKKDAMAPLFNLDLSWDDFPEEKGQSDGTIAHAIERLLGIVPQALNFNAMILKDRDDTSTSTFRWDQQYFPRTIDSIKAQLLDPTIKVIAFDIFDTLLIRTLLHPDHTKQILANNLSAEHRAEFCRKRSAAESSARAKLGKDISITDIYSELSQCYGIDASEALRLQKLEETIEKDSVSCRPDMLDIFNFAKENNKKVIIASDMFLSLETITEMLTENGYSGWDNLYLSSDRGVRKDTGELYQLILDEYNVSGNEFIMIGDNERSDYQLPFDSFGIRTIHILRATDLALHIPEYSRVARKAYAGDLNDELTFGLLINKSLNKIGDFSIHDLKLFSNDAYQIGFNLVGPLLTAFANWTRMSAEQNNIDCLYFLAREGKLIKEVYDLWFEGQPSSVASKYLVVSRRAVNVPNITTLEDVLAIAKSTYYPNTLSMFVRERFGITLSDEKLEEIYSKGLWAKGKLVEVNNENTTEVKDVLNYLLPDIIKDATEERNGLMQYLSDVDFTVTENKAVVDVGYSGTIQKALIKLLSEPVHGFYIATKDDIQHGLVNAIASGCYVDRSQGTMNANSLILRNSFKLEKLLSSDDSQIVKYVPDEAGSVSPVFKHKHDEEKSTYQIRAELQKGCMDFVNAAINVRNNFYPEFSPSLKIADALYSDFIISTTHKENDFIKTMILDDDYCGRGLVN